MGLFRKKPVVIEARRLTPETYPDILEWLCANVSEIVLDREDPADPYIIIQTPEGAMKARNGDWIIRGIKGEFYPCKHDIFKQTYEPAGASV